MDTTHETCELSIITINYNGLEDTCELLATLPLDDASVEVIVVDNASREDEATLISQRFPQVRVIRSERNLGFAGGNNLGIKAARGKYLYFLNNDTLLAVGGERFATNGEPLAASGEPLAAKDAFTSLTGRLESAPNIGAVCPKIRFAWDDHPIQYAGYTALSPVTLRNRAIGYGEPDRGQYDTPYPTPYAHGAAMMIRREAIERAGLMPECYFLYYEELDWSMMLRRAGYDIWYEPAATVYHKESRSTGQESPLRTYYLTRNRLLFVRRNIPMPGRCLAYLYLLLIAGSKDILKFTFRLRPDLAKACLRGMGHFLKMQ